MAVEREELESLAIEELGEGSSSIDVRLPSLAHSRVIAELGSGGMAEVYLVVNSYAGITKLLVLKALHTELASDPEVLPMFLDEARLAMKLNHPNVVQTYEMGVHEGRHALVMEYLEGQSLSRILQRAVRLGRPLPLRVSLAIIIAALEGLEYVHELKGLDGQPLGLVHRDVSPQNVFVTYDGQVKLLDFGIAKAKDSSTHTAIGVVKGKVSYMAPEQMAGEPVDRRTDIYAIGCVLWALATGRKLWEGVADAPLMVRVLAGDVPSFAEQFPEFDRAFARIVDKALAAQPEERYQTAHELQRDLEAYAEGLGAPIKGKELGALVSELFADEREHIRRHIELQLSALKETEPSSREFARSRSAPRMTAPGPSVVTVPASQERRLAPWVLALAVPVCIGIGIVVAVQRVEVPSAEPTSAPAAVALEDLPPPAVRENTAVQTNITVRFDVEPRTAQLFLDGKALPRGTVSRVLPASEGSTHTLRAEAPGHEATEREFVAARDTVVSLSLVKTKKTPPAAPRRKPAAVSAPPTVKRPVAEPTKSAPSAPAVCQDPFFISEEGIKLVRPECR